VEVVVRDRVVAVAELAHAEHELVRVNGRANEEAAWLKAVRHIAEEGPQLGFALEHVVDGKLSAHNIKSDLEAHILHLLPQQRVHQVLFVACIAHHEHRLKNLGLSVLAASVPHLALAFLFHERLYHVLVIALLSLGHESVGEVETHIVRYVSLLPLQDVTTPPAA